jgi:hypothetical protein
VPEKRWTTDRGLPDYIGMGELAARAGVDPAHVYAWREVGYLATDDNVDTLSPLEVLAYEDAVARHRAGELALDWLGPHGEDTDAIDAACHGAAGSLQLTVERVLREGSSDPVWALLRRLLSEAPGGDETAFGFKLLLGIAGIWVTSARGDCDPVAVVAWVADHLGPDAAQTAAELAGLLGHPVVHYGGLDEARAALGSGVLPGLLWLCAGIAATVGHGHAVWLRQYDLTWEDVPPYVG